MPVFHVLGDSVLAPADFRARAQEISQNASFGVASFTSIGLNQPLSVLIRHLYTGKYPKQGTFNSPKDMLVTSAMKDVAVFNAAPRALNFLRPRVAANSNFSTPAATEQGTPLVSYSPAVISASTILTLEIVFDNFPDDLFNKVQSALTSLAGIPAFLPYSGYLVAAGSIARLAGNLGHALFDGKPVFSATETIDFDVPGASAAEADFRIVCDPNFDASDFKFDPKSGLVDKTTGQPYRGDQPYIVLSLDGKARPEYENFLPTAVSATLMERFYNVKEGSEAVVDALFDAMKLYSDSKYRSQADVVGKKLAQITDKSSAQAQDMQARYNALVANILTDALKPS